MEDYEENSSVDPEIKAHITNLVAALGGNDQSDPHQPYKLGDDGLACLRDLKRWLKGYDERLDRWDVARAISETSLVTVDLVEILTEWEINSQDTTKPPGKHQDRIALACLELLVPLTWPLQLDKLSSTNNHYRHAPHLQQARLRYKRSILMHPRKLIFKAIIRVAIPYMRFTKRDRSPRDDAVLKLVVYFFRNILAISPPEPENVWDDISRNTTILALNEQKVFGFLVTLGAGIGHDYQLQDTGILECLFYLFRGLRVNEIFDLGREGPVNSGLKQLLATERNIRRDIQRNSSSRHTRFGTMVSMVVEDKARLSISGQGAVVGTSETLNKLDASKKWRKPIRRITEQGVSG
jgi:replication fork protection complex subunit Tof1/Swi1